MQVVIGVDINWQEPMAPKLIFETNTLRPPNELALKIHKALKLKIGI